MPKHDQLCKGYVSPIWWNPKLISYTETVWGWHPQCYTKTMRSPVYYLTGQCITQNGTGVYTQLNIYPN